MTGAGFLSPAPDPETAGTAALCYGDYIAESVRRQQAYIRREQARAALAARLHEKYRRAMLRIGFHPLSHGEIDARLAQLQSMQNAVAETHGDSPANRRLYEALHGLDEQPCLAPPPAIAVAKAQLSLFEAAP